MFDLDSSRPSNLSLSISHMISPLVHVKCKEMSINSAKQVYSSHCCKHILTERWREAHKSQTNGMFSCYLQEENASFTFAALLCTLYEFCRPLSFLHFPTKKFVLVNVSSTRVRWFPPRPSRSMNTHASIQPPIPSSIASRVFVCKVERKCKCGLYWQFSSHLSPNNLEEYSKPRSSPVIRTWDHLVHYSSVSAVCLAKAPLRPINKAWNIIFRAAVCSFSPDILALNQESRIIRYCGVV